jgi:DNA-binding transcriptional regulator YhcF (GntR family)
MEFKGSQPIYLQIADIICEKILRGEWKEGDRIPSIRELAASVEVNPNTVMRTFTLLQDKDIIVNQRGIGFFVSGKGQLKARAYMLENFITNDLSVTFRKMELLNMGINEIMELYNGCRNKGGDNETFK